MKLFKTPYYSKKNIIVSENPYASYIGLKVLEENGNAIDAAVSASFTLAVTLPHLSGFGGDFFALIYNFDKDSVYFINGSGYAPSNISIEHLIDKGFHKMPIHGIYSITVPGYVDGLYEMWRRLGSLEWANLLKRPTELVENGFPISNTLFNSISQFKKDLYVDSGSKYTFISADVNGPGNIVRFPSFYKTLKKLSEDPRDFYEGDIMRSIIKYLNNYDHIFTEDDFKKYHAEWRSPLKTYYKDKLIYEMPPNTQGVTTLHILKMLEDIDLKRYKPSSWKRIENFLKIFKKAYCIRDRFISDPRYMKIDPHELLSIDFLKEMNKGCKVSSGIGGEGDTTYFSIIDNYGNIVSAIQSLFYRFGSYITEPKYGITFNSRASSFILDKDHVNSLSPGKKPLHTLSTPIVFDGKRIIAHGLSGGYYRPQLHSQIITNMLDYNMSPQEAIEYPRFIWNGEEDEITVEEGIETYKSDKVISVKYGSRIGVAATAIYYYNGVKSGHVDIRGEGMALGEV